MTRSDRLRALWRRAWQTLLPALALTTLSLAAHGCGDDAVEVGAPYTLGFSGGGFGPHEGQTIAAAVVETAAGVVVTRDTTVVTGGAFSFSWAGVLQPGKAYRVDYYADVNANGECEASDDHVWSATIGPVSGAVTVKETHSLSFTPSACQSFKSQAEVKYALTFTGSGYGPHDGQTLYVAVVRVDQQKVIKSSQTTVSGGGFAFSWDSALERGKSYTIDFYADVNGDGACTAGQDHVWRVDVPAVTKAVALDETHNLSFTPAACSSF